MQTLNHHVGYSQENECWFVRFYPYQTEQQAKDAVSAFTLPSAPVAGLVCETCNGTGNEGRGLICRDCDEPTPPTGLVRYTLDNRPNYDHDGNPYADPVMSPKLNGEYVLFSQAEAIIAAERSEKEIAERNRDAARENFLTMQKSAAKLLERAEKAEADLQTHIDGTTALVNKKVDAEFNALDLEKANAALTARVKELEELLRSSESCNHFADNLSKEMRTLEADNKRLREALETLLRLNDDSGPFGGEIYQDRVDRAWENARAALGEVKT